MNLTSKRVLASLMAIVGLFAMSAKAELFQDTFEAAESWTTTLQGESPSVFYAIEGTLLKNYKSSYEDNAGWFQTFPNWEVTGGTDNSTIVAGTYDFTADSRPALIAVDAENNPITTTAQYLNLNTEGATITRNVNQTMAAPVYLDTMIKFAKSDEPPTLDGEYKLALYVNATSNLVVCSADANGAQQVSSETTMVIDPEQWYRLTIQAAFSEDMILPMYKVFVNGNQIVADGVCTYFDGATVSDETWFVGCDPDDTFKSVSFRGTGALDDLTVTDQAPIHTAPTTMTITVSFDDDILDVYNGETLLTAAGGTATVESPAQLKVFAKDWYVLGDPTATDATIADKATLGIGDLVTNVNFTATATASGAAVAIAADIIPEATVAPIGGVQQPVGKIAKWANGYKSVNEVLTGFADETSDLYNRYLMNITSDEVAVPTLTIDSIEYTDAGAVITVVTNDANFDFADINGTLTVLAGSDLANLQAVDLDASAVVVNGAEATITVPAAAGNFIRAVVK